MDSRSNVKLLLPFLFSCLLATPFILEAEDAQPLNEQIRKLIAQLSDPVFKNREVASNTLIELGTDHLEQVLALLPRNAEDPEIQDRCDTLRTAIPWSRVRRDALAAARGDVLLEKAVEKATTFVYAARSEETLGPPFMENQGIRDLCKGVLQDRNPQAVLIIAAFLQAPEPRVREDALDAVHWGSGLAVPAAPYLTALLTHPDPGVLGSILKALRWSKSPGMAEQVLPLLKHAEPSVRREAAIALGQLGSKPHAQKLLPLLKDPDAEVRGNVAGALGDLGVASTAVEVVKLLGDSVADVRDEAVGALAKLGDSSLIPAIDPLLKDPEIEVRAQAVSTLGKLGAKAYADRFADYLKDEEEGILVKKAALGALGDLHQVQHTPLVASFLNQPRLRSNAIKTIAQLGDRSFAPRIVRMLTYNTNGAAMRALIQFGDRSVIPLCIRRLDHAHEAQAIQTIRVLRGLNAKEAIPYIAPFLDHPMEWVQAEAAGTLATLSGIETPDPDDDKRNNALIATMKAWWAQHRRDSAYTRDPGIDLLPPSRFEPPESSPESAPNPAISARIQVLVRQLGTPGAEGTLVAANLLDIGEPSREAVLEAARHGSSEAKASARDILTALNDRILRENTRKAFDAAEVVLRFRSTGYASSDLTDTLSCDAEILEILKGNFPATIRSLIIEVSKTADSDLRRVFMHGPDAPGCPEFFVCLKSENGRYVLLSNEDTGFAWDTDSPMGRLVKSLASKP